MEIDRIRPMCRVTTSADRLERHRPHDTPHVREDVPERQLTTWLLLDQSAVDALRDGDRRKADVAEGAALVVGRFAARRGGRLGIVAFGRRRPGRAAGRR